MFNRENPDYYGVYSIDSVSLVGSEYELVVTEVSSNGQLDATDTVGLSFDFGSAGASPGSASVQVDSTSNGLTGVQDGANTLFTVSQGSYTSGSLIVYFSGSPQVVGYGLTETNPAAGTFTLDDPPESYDIIIAQYAY